MLLGKEKPSHDTVLRRCLYCFCTTRRSLMFIKAAKMAVRVKQRSVHAS